MIKALKTRRAYRALLLDEHGQLKPEAQTVLEDLYGYTRMFEDSPPDPQALAMVEGGRRAVRRILKQTKALDAELKRQVHQGVYDDE